MRWTLVIGVAFFLSVETCDACLWDNDTLEVERSRFPSTLELITGKFLRHSDAYYRWRVEDRLRRLAEQPRAEWYDDLGVAYDKLSQHEQAIETAFECERRFPGRYETAANLGTFHIHAGELEAGLSHIRRALAINPDAHFGRERYQALLAEYVLSNCVNGATPSPLEPNTPFDPEAPDEPYDTQESRGFAAYCEQHLPPEEIADISVAWRENALEGVLGMMRFGSHDSPILLEALADLLMVGGRKEDARRLAARAYLLAGSSHDRLAVRDGYDRLAAYALNWHVVHDTVGIGPRMTVEDLRTRLARERRNADLWWDEVEQRERAWVAAGVDVDAEFAKAYYDSPAPVKSPAPWTYGQRLRAKLGVGLLCCVSLAAAAVWALRKTLRPLKRGAP